MKTLISALATTGTRSEEPKRDQDACACPPHPGIVLDAYPVAELPAALRAFLDNEGYAHLRFVDWGGTRIDLDEVKKSVGELDYGKLKTCIQDRGSRFDEALLLVFFALNTDVLFTVPKGFFPRLTQSRFKLPEFVKAVESEAFGECSSVREIVLPKECQRLDAKAFVGCTSLKRVTLSNVALLPDQGTPFDGVAEGLTISLDLGVNFGVPVEWEQTTKYRTIWG